jgi:hypothetical protein
MYGQSYLLYGKPKVCRGSVKLDTCFACPKTLTFIACVVLFALPLHAGEPTTDRDEWQYQEWKDKKGRKMIAHLVGRVYKRETKEWVYKFHLESGKDAIVHLDVLDDSSTKLVEDVLADRAEAAKVRRAQAKSARALEKTEEVVEDEGDDVVDQVRQSRETAKQARYAIWELEKDKRIGSLSSEEKAAYEADCERLRPLVDNAGTTNMVRLAENFEEYVGQVVKFTGGTIVGGVGLDNDVDLHVLRSYWTDRNDNPTEQAARYAQKRGKVCVTMSSELAEAIRSSTDATGSFGVEMYCEVIKGNVTYLGEDAEYNQLRLLRIDFLNNGGEVYQSFCEGGLGK